MGNYYSEHFEISSHDVDTNKNVRPSVLVRLMQETANHHMRDRRPTYYELFAEGKSYILVRFTCEARESLHPYDKIEVRTWTGQTRGVTFRRNYLVLRGEEEIARAYSEWAVVEISTGRLCRTDEVDASNYETGDQIEMTMPVKFHFAKDQEFTKCGVRNVGYCDCDMNFHMNNTNYPDILWNHVPDVQDKVWTGLSLRFMAEAHMGKDIEILRAKADDVVDDGCSPEETWYFKTLVEGKTNLEAIVNLKNY